MYVGEVVEWSSLLSSVSEAVVRVDVCCCVFVLGFLCLFRPFCFVLFREYNSERVYLYSRDKKRTDSHCRRIPKPPTRIKATAD